MGRRRHELTDFEWSIIEPLLPRKSRGVPRVDDRRVLNGIGGSEPDHHGPTFPSATARIRPATIALCDGAKPVSGITF